MELWTALVAISLIVGFLTGRWRRNAAENSGEASVRRRLTSYCKDIDSHLLNNVTVQCDDGSSTQIDHILITTKGVFVIETKDYKGWIFANPKAKTWTQTIYKNKFKFQNPIRQNYKHIKALESLLDFLEPSLIQGMVVFTGEAEFKTAKPDGVYYIKELITAIKRHQEEKLSLNRVQFCVGRIEYHRFTLTHKTDVQHQANLIRKFGN